MNVNRCHYICLQAAISVTFILLGTRTLPVPLVIATFMVTLQLFVQASFHASIDD